LIKAFVIGLWIFMFLFSVFEILIFKKRLKPNRLKAWIYIIAMYAYFIGIMAFFYKITGQKLFIDELTSSGGIWDYIFLFLFIFPTFILMHLAARSLEGRK